MHFCYSLQFLVMIIWNNLEYMKANEGILSARWQDCKNHLLVGDNVKLSASSIYKNYSKFLPEKAIFMLEGDGKSSEEAWCPKTQVKNEEKEWIQVEFNQLTFITIIFMSGRLHSNTNEYVPFFVLKYQRENDDQWLTYKTYNHSRIIQGSYNAHVLERHHFEPPVLVTRLRIYPYAKIVRRTMCLRFALFGCDFNDGVTSYEMPQGDLRAFDAHGGEAVVYPPRRLSKLHKIYYFRDDSYDGNIKEGMLSGGMGQLMDDKVFKLGVDNDTHPLSFAYSFVGWRRNPGDHVTIIFTFNAVRVFNNVTFYSYNSRTEGYGIFSKVEALFSVGGKIFRDDDKVTLQKHPRAITRDKYYVETMNLKARIGRFVQLKLYFSEPWLILSEISFSSVISRTSVAPETVKMDNVGGRPEVNILVENRPNANEDSDTIPRVSQPTGLPNGNNRSSGSDQSTSNIIVTLLAIFLVIAIVLCVLFIWRWRRRHLQRKKIKCKMADSVQCTALGSTNGPCMAGIMWGYQTPNRADCNGSYPFNSYSVGERNSYGLNQYVTNGVASQQPLLKEHHNSLLYNNVATDDEEGDCLIPNAYSTPGCNLRPSPDQVPIEYASTTLFSNPSPGFRSSQPPPIAPPMLYFPPSPFRQAVSTNGSISSGGVNELYQTPAALAESRLGTSSCYESTGNMTSLSVHIPQMHTALLKMCSETFIQGTVGSSVYAWLNGCSHNSSSSNEKCQGRSSQSPLPPLPKLQLKSFTLLERLGGGEFGDIHLAEVVDDDSMPANYSGQKLNGDKPLVAIKMLRRDAPEQARQDFQSETNILVGLCDPNLAGIYGVCLEGGTVSVIVEYARHGDLCQFLRTRRHIPASPADLQHVISAPMHGAKESTDILSFGCLIYLAVQVASGMKYLESLGLVHRDLACRNCLVGPRFSVKISDLGMCRRVYAADYCRIEGKAPIPIRWMSWEAILQSKFSTKSDVWSFATTLWEMLTLCRHQPLDHLTNEQIIENCVRGLTDPAPSPPCDLPPCPPLCTKEIYDLMLECWQRQESQRPTFREIHMFLQRKNLGFNAEQEYQMARITNLSSLGSCLH